MKVNSLTEDFNTFINKISLTETLRQDLISKHRSLEKLLKEDLPEGYNVAYTRLSGSYGKLTEIKEIDENKNPDVDVVAIIETTNTDVVKVMNDFTDYLREKKKNYVKNIRLQSNSIGLKYENVDVDLVLAKENGDNELYIASSNEMDWLKSNCLKQVEFMREQNNKYGFSYRKLMKLFKYLNKARLNNKLKSYTLEMMVHQCVPNNRVDLTLWGAFTETLENICLLGNIFEIKDCCNKNNKGYDEKDVYIFYAFQLEIEKIYKMAQEAINGNRKKWRDIFGDKFPDQPVQKVENNNSFDRKQTPWLNE